MLIISGAIHMTSRHSSLFSVRLELQARESPYCISTKPHVRARATALGASIRYPNSLVRC
jgi:hypothetical protein